MISKDNTKYMYLKSKPEQPPDFSPSADVPAIVRGVIDDIRQNGDAAVRKYSTSKLSFAVLIDDLSLSIRIS
jgi:histidinol dehydrogenase